MLSTVLTTGLAALVIWALYSAVRPRAAFVIRVRAGVPRVVRGTVKPAFVAEVAEVCRRHNVQEAAVSGVKRDNRIALAFSGSISESCRQQLRNVWSLSGWSARL
jgi:hypothetical protein